MSAVGLFIFIFILIAFAQGNKTNCYPELGCFPMGYPWTSLTRPLPPPHHPTKINVGIYCYTRDSPKKYITKLWPEMSLNSCPFIGTRKTVFITHGFSNNGNLSWISYMRERYLNMVDANVFVVDWGDGSQLLNYLQVASNTRVVGAEVTRFIKFLRDKYELDPALIHLIGHSLGAQISSYVGKGVPGVGQLTALDPAQPGFEAEATTVRLTKGDAIFIDAIHTNAAPFVPSLGFGLMMPYGDVDIYMNGGIYQPGCRLPDITKYNITSFEDLARFSVEVIIDLVGCSHCRSYEYYSQVLQDDCIIWARRATLPDILINAGTTGLVEPLLSNLHECTAETCTQVGLNTSLFPARGVFIAVTPMFAPYCEDPAISKSVLSQVGVLIKTQTTGIIKAMQKAMKPLNCPFGICK